VRDITARADVQLSPRRIFSYPMPIYVRLFPVGLGGLENSNLLSVKNLTRHSKFSQDVLAVGGDHLRYRLVLHNLRQHPLRGVSVSFISHSPGWFVDATVSSYGTQAHTFPSGSVKVAPGNYTGDIAEDPDSFRVVSASGKKRKLTVREPNGSWSLGGIPIGDIPAGGAIFVEYDANAQVSHPPPGLAGGEIFRVENLNRRSEGERGLTVLAGAGDTLAFWSLVDTNSHVPTEVAARVLIRPVRPSSFKTVRLIFKVASPGKALPVTPVTINFANEADLRLTYIGGSTRLSGWRRPLKTGSSRYCGSNSTRRIDDGITQGGVDLGVIGSNKFTPKDPCLGLQYARILSLKMRVAP
jgi:hypothetical protein